MNRSMRLVHTSNITDVKKATPFAAYVKICCVYVYIYTYAYIFMKHDEYNMIIHIYIIYIYMLHICYPPEKKHISN